VVLVTGSQLRAARALAEVDQKTLAEEAGVNVNTIRGMERRGGQTLTSGLETIRKVQGVLERRGIEFLNHGEPGVRLRRK
jgi:transcriptional regulator with XRE-family HTH domain